MLSLRKVATRPKLLFVGAFPPPGHNVYGGNVRDCQLLLQSPFVAQLDLIAFDTTQRSNPPPKLVARLGLAAVRSSRYLWALIIARPDAVCLICSGGASLIEKSMMALLARAIGKRTLVFPRGGSVIDGARKSRVHRVMHRLLLRCSSYMLCMGPEWQRFAVTEMGFPPQRAPIVPSWSATNELLAVGKSRRARMISRIEPVRLLFVGWLEEGKGIKELLEACHNLERKGVNFMLTIAGRGRAEPYVREFVSRHSLQERISFAGWVEGSALTDLWQTNDVFVLPTWTEGLPNALIEAMAAGLAVVTTPVGSIPDYVKHELHGLLVSPRNAHALTEALQQVIEDQELRTKLGQQAHALARSTFGMDIATTHFADMIIQSLERH